MFQTYVPNQKVQGKKITLHYYYYLKNAMIRNIKTRNIFDMIKISKSIELKKCIHKLFL